MRRMQARAARGSSGRKVPAAPAPIAIPEAQPTPEAQAIPAPTPVAPEAAAPMNAAPMSNWGVSTGAQTILTAV